ncbi:MAG: hypothetical protein HN383_13245 [Verrucomicrobia bacterium]|jgi:hypothetical protein|nr:hypothetical protein [Verrucomicrobiota bacterium]MBT7700946.1 hypothetical protein [Verrucomicrobiota bacterium]
MTKLKYVVFMTLFALSGQSFAEEYDFYKHLSPPLKPVPGIGRNTVEQDGGHRALGYKRRTVQWWPRKGQDIIDIPEGAPLRTWTRNTGDDDGEALEGFCRVWKTTDPKTFKAHLVGFRGTGISTPHADARWNFKPIPIAILRTEDGRQISVHNARFYSWMVSKEDHEFIHAKWEEAFPKLYATTLQDEALTKKGSVPGGDFGDFEMKHWTAARPKFYGTDGPMNKTYPRWGRNGYKLAFETPHFFIIAQPDIWGGPWGTPQNWLQPDNVERETLYRKGAMESIENLWTYLEGCGGSMPYWRSPGPNYRFIIHSHRNRAAAGAGHCGISDVDRAGIGHEFCHNMPVGGWDGMYYETWANAGQHITIPGEFQMFPGNFCYPWRNVNRLQYQSSFWAFALGDNPNWGHGAPISIGSLAGAAEPTPYHSVARLGEKRGLWKNGIKGWGDWWGEYAARMVTVDTIEKNIVGRYGMPTLSAVYPVYGHANRYRISAAESPRFCGFNIIRLQPEEGAGEITVDFQGIHDPALHSDWRACIVAVDAEGRPRYSSLWNKGEMTFELKPSDMNLWLSVSASPSAFPVLSKDSPHHKFGPWFLMGVHAPRYPWEITLAGCQPGAPHRRQGDVDSFDHLSGITDYGNKFLDIPVTQEAPIPLEDRYGKLAAEKLPAMQARIQGAIDAIDGKVKAGTYAKDGWWKNRKLGILNDMARRATFLQDNAKGKHHPNGGGFVAGGARVAKSAYVGPNAMVLDGARVKDHACIKGFAIVRGPKTVISGNAKIDGRSCVFGDIEVGGNARILEAATVTTTKRGRYGDEVGRAKIDGNAVIKGDSIVWLCGEKLTLTGGVVVDYASFINTKSTGVCENGRFCNESWRRPHSLTDGADDGALYANWQFNQPKAVTLEDSYVNNNGFLYGKPAFTEDGDHQSIAFNGKDQYAMAPSSVADFGALTLDMMIKRTGGKGEKIFDFGTGADDCFYLETANRKGKLSLVAASNGKKQSLKTSAAVPADKWTRVRVAMDGATAAIYIDGKQVATGTFKFKPRDVFVGDRPEGNFIASGRDGSGFFKGRMDHFRIYRTVHQNFSALGPPPSALTHMSEWSEKSQDLADTWEAQKKATEAELSAGEYGELQQEIKDLHAQRSTQQENPDLKTFDDRVRAADKAKRDLDRKLHDALRADPANVKAEREVKELRDKIKGITQTIRESAEYTSSAAEIQAAEQKRAEAEKQARETPALTALSVRIDAANAERGKAEARIKELPELKTVMELHQQEEDGNRKRDLLKEHNRLFAARRDTDLEWQKAGIAIQRLSRLRDETVRNARNSDTARKKAEQQVRKLREKQNDLFARLKESHPELIKLEETVAATQGQLNVGRKQLEEKARAAQDYTQAEAELDAARKAQADERKRFQQEPNKAVEQLNARIAAVKKDSQTLRDTALSSAHLLGKNPYPGKEAAALHDFQKKLEYRTRADWDYRLKQEIDGTAPQKMKDWLKRMRGY